MISHCIMIQAVHMQKNQVAVHIIFNTIEYLCLEGEESSCSSKKHLERENSESACAVSITPALH